MGNHCGDAGTEAGSAFGAERCLATTAPPPLNHNPENRRVIGAIMMETTRPSGTRKSIVPTPIPTIRAANNTSKSGFDQVRGFQFSRISYDATVSRAAVYRNPNRASSRKPDARCRFTSGSPDSRAFQDGSWPPIRLFPAHQVVAEFARIAQVGHLPAVEVVLGKALLGKSLHPVGVAASLGAEQTVAADLFGRARVVDLV